MHPKAGMSLRPPPALEPHHLQQLAIFPLPGAVLFPSTLMPLHIFEPRYRQMTRDALAGQRPVAMVSPVPGAPLDARGRPPILPVAGVGSIVQHEELPDGRFHILLLGQGRIWIEEEHDVDTLYRQVRARWHEDQGEPAPQVENRLMTVRQVVFGLHRAQPQLAAALARLLAQDLPAGHVTDALSNALFADPDDRQALLEDLSMVSRLERILRRLLALFEPTGSEPSVMH